MSESPTPDVPEPEPQAAPVAASPTPAAQPEPKPSRLRRLWRWSKKWGKRFAIVLLVLLVVTSIVYPIHRHLAFKASEKALADVRAELDATEPGWRYEDIEAAHNSRVPAREQNSVRLLENLGKINAIPPDRRPGADDSNVREFLKQGLGAPTNELPLSVVRSYLDSFPKDFPAANPDIIELAKSPVGGFPMISAYSSFHPDWDRFRELTAVDYKLELAGTAAAARGDGSAAIVYTRAILNAGRAIGNMPRLPAQWQRHAAAKRAVRMAIRTLAWCEPADALADLRRELLAEADHEWLALALRGERAVLNRSVPPLTVEGEIELLYPPQSNGLRLEPDWELRAVMFLARPYREGHRAAGLLEITRVLAHCKLSPHERYKALTSLERERAKESHTTMFHAWWDRKFSFSTMLLAESDCDTRARLRTAAVGIACEEFRRVNRRWPNTLDEIPKTLLPTIPTDPFTGTALTYELTDTGPFVFSVGPSGMQGAHSSTSGLVGVRLWNPALRGLPPKDLFAQPEMPDVPDAP